MTGLLERIENLRSKLDEDDRRDRERVLGDLEEVAQWLEDREEATLAYWVRRGAWTVVRLANDSNEGVGDAAP